MKSKNLKFLGVAVLSGGLVLSPLGVGDSVVNASSENKTTQAQAGDEQVNEEMANIIYSNLAKSKDGDLVISDEGKLKKDLNSSNLGVSVKDVQTYVQNYNATIKGENGKKAQKQLKTYNSEVEKHMKNQVSNDKFRSKCSTAISVSVLLHTGATTAAMTALGVSGPVGWGVGFGMAALYTAGSTLC